MPNDSQTSRPTTTHISEVTRFSDIPIILDKKCPRNEIHFYQGDTLIGAIRDGEIIYPPVSVASQKPTD